MKAIVLCGFMGCGKSAVGRELAHQLGCRFIDMDTYIEEQAGCSVSEIFATLGEAHFRALEREACKTLAACPNCVIATGGGALTFPENVAAFRQARCPIVLIDTPLPIIMQRLIGDTSRPLLQGEDRAQKAQLLYEQRMPLYRAAATTVIPGTEPPFILARRLRHLKSGKHW